MRLYGDREDEKSVLLELARLRNEGMSFGKCAAHLNGRWQFNSNGDPWTESSVTMVARAHLDAERVILNVTSAAGRMALGLRLMEMVASGTGEKAELARMALDVYAHALKVGMGAKDAAETARDITKMERDKRRQEAI